MKKISTTLSLILIKDFLVGSVLPCVVFQIVNAIGDSTLEEKQGNFIEAMVGVIWVFILTWRV